MTQVIGELVAGYCLSEIEWIIFNYMSKGLFSPPRESNSCDFLRNLKSTSTGNLNSGIEFRKSYSIGVQISKKFIIQKTQP